MGVNCPGYIGSYRESFAAPGLDQRDGPVQRFASPPSYDDVRPLRREREGDRLPDAGPGTGDEGGPAGEAVAETTAHERASFLTDRFNMRREKAPYVE
jgi:hypothetical protein